MKGDNQQTPQRAHLEQFLFFYHCFIHMIINFYYFLQFVILTCRSLRLGTYHVLIIGWFVGVSNFKIFYLALHPTSTPMVGDVAWKKQLPKKNNRVIFPLIQFLLVLYRCDGSRRHRQKGTFFIIGWNARDLLPCVVTSLTAFKFGLLLVTIIRNIRGSTYKQLATEVEDLPV